MNYFLDREWLALMEQTSSISRACRLEVEGQTVWVGEYQNARQKKWQLFGAWEKDGAPWLEALFALGDRHGVFQIECAFNMARWTDKEMLEGLGAEITEEFGTYAVDLGLEPETLWSGLHGKHRNMIQRARRENLRVFFDVDAEALAATMDETYAKGGVDNPFSRSYLRHLLALAGPKMLLAGVSSDRGLEAAAVIPMDTTRGYFLHGATRPEGTPGAANLLHWEVMLNLKGRGVTTYDLGGARRQTDDPRLAGIFRFKERFGGRFQPCWYWRKVIHPGRKMLHDLMVRVQKTWS